MKNTMAESLPTPYTHNLVSSLYAMKGMIENFLLKQEEGRFADEKETLEKSQEVLKRAFRQADHALQVVKKLGTMKEESSRGGPQRTSILETWEAALSLLRKEEALEEVEILERIPDPFPLVQCFKEDLKEIFYHLIQNACQAMQGKGILVIRTQISFTTQEEPLILIQVSDTGPGIPESMLRRLFEPFFTTKPRGIGNGLGLYSTRQLVVRNGGRIAVSSFKGAGTTFTLEFPLAK